MATSETILKIENLSKQYRLGVVGTGTLSHDLKRWWYKIRGKEDPYIKIGEINDRATKGSSEYVWALKDINLEVKKGEVLGIIGKNGAGKSTLLKILSKVTGPTTGTVKAKGRIASLLEVGTGFHPELTGKENIFLNGAILGMTKIEISSKYDEIVGFSGCERYIDTPVKRYSSGMRVRLAFAVAAFLEPDILVIDEVLAVGDAEFQKKAVGKMQEISKGDGRTVLFVSHNMAAVKNLCTRGIVIDQGGVVFEGDQNKAVDYYLSFCKKLSSEKISMRVDRDGTQEFLLDDVLFYNSNNERINEIISGDSLTIKLLFRKRIEFNFNKILIALNFLDTNSDIIASFISDEMGFEFIWSDESPYLYLRIPKLLLRENVYSLRIIVSKDDFHHDNFIDKIENVGIISVLKGDFWNSGFSNRSGSYCIIPGKFQL